MKLTVFPSDHGDCLLLESGEQRMLIDGGPGRAFKEYVLPALAKRRRAIDCVYLSHIDHDHIGGLLALVDAIYEWRVYEYRKERKKKPQKPKMPRPPDIRKVWHNSFPDLLGEHAVPVADALASTAEILSGLNEPDPTAAAVRMHHQDLAAHAGHAIQLTNRISRGQLGIPVNPEYGDELMSFSDHGKPPKLTLGDIRFTLLGPTKEDLDNLKKDWKKWLEKNKDKVRQIRRAARVDEHELVSSDANFLAPLEMEARTLVDELSTPAIAEKEKVLGLGRRKRVTPPNLASLMFLAEDAGHSILLTGDGHGNDILDKLEKRGKLNVDRKLHVNVLKVQHHGAEHNMTKDFAERITADHYVFCGNGYATNPEPSVLETIANARTTGNYKFWFNCTPKPKEKDDHMQKVAACVKKLAKASKGRLTYEFIDEAFVVPLPK
jgi:hypothetical protein